MRRPSGQISMLVLDIEEWLPENHLLRKINQLVSFDFIYDLAALYYPASSRPSVDPVSMFKMLLVGYPFILFHSLLIFAMAQIDCIYRDYVCFFDTAFNPENIELRPRLHLLLFN